ncbi:hypothetical protein [Burkholderia cepacia]|uniref:Bacteriophage protein n=1 Tax=Burkholderia cepacia TaxID=292 RepID=A0AAX2RKG8_BURCE|nr:hypothetical protein [Burkholderia cepacia]TES99610.1 hypothetical protein E3D36_24285 [Burkholderia cepacia]TEU41603.1 hypothetical protein E3D37_26670 [Burkholderia cepacia]TEU48769.1 hypothetical protein E3D38_21465 [Burkholderia cepacia]TEU95344.1 hypothetical protein E3D40_24760 [Burkholderia cepacia]TEV04738.1 hypothetical protein E3D44_26285 [Burkholderia cepacia]
MFVPSSKPDSKAVLTGHIDLGLGDGRIAVFAFVNERKDEGSVPTGAKYISLTTRKVHPRSGEIGYFPVAIGNVVNSRSDGGEVFFDTVIFNPVDEDLNNIPGVQPVAVWVTEACDAALHAKLGFTSARVARPKKQDEVQSDAAAVDPDDEQISRAAMLDAVAQATGGHQ